MGGRWETYAIGQGLFSPETTPRAAAQTYFQQHKARGVNVLIIAHRLLFHLGLFVLKVVLHGTLLLGLASWESLDLGLAHRISSSCPNLRQTVFTWLSEDLERYLLGSQSHLCRSE